MLAETVAQTDGQTLGIIIKRWCQNHITARVGHFSFVISIHINPSIVVSVVVYIHSVVATQYNALTLSLNRISKSRLLNIVFAHS